jgi:hypothetical protein
MVPRRPADRGSAENIAARRAANKDAAGEGDVSVDYNLFAEKE